MFSKDHFYEVSSAKSVTSQKKLSCRAPRSLPLGLQRKTTLAATELKADDECSRAVSELSNEESNRIARRIHQYPSSESDSEDDLTSSGTGSPVSSVRRQRYIPGLNRQDDPNVICPGDDEDESDVKKVPEALIEGFLAGTKNPISTLMEYSVAQKLVVVFEECKVERPSIVARFACRVKINGKALPQGTGSTKKDAKTDAAKIAMSMLLGLEKDDVDNKEDAGYKLWIDSCGRTTHVKKTEDDDESMFSASTTVSSKLSELRVRNFEPKIELPSIDEAGVRPIWDPPKHPVSKLTEYCSKRNFPISWAVSPRPTDIGFKADVYICNDLIETAYSLSKKDAKRICAEKALAKFAPNEAAEVANYTQEACQPSRPIRMPSYRAASQREENNDASGYQIRSTSPSTSEELEELKNICKNQGFSIDIVVTDIPDTDGLYEAHVCVNGNVVSLEEGTTKKEAKRLAAQEAINELKSKLPKEVTIESLPFHDRIEAMTLKAFSDLLAPTHENPALHKYLAAFIISENPKDAGKVVALGTGNTTLPAVLKAGNGRQIFDLHAVVIARRALLRYFYREMKNFYSGNPSSIFEPKPGTSLLTLRKGVAIRLYLSRAPCGDAVIQVNLPDTPLPADDSRIAGQPMHYPTFPTPESGFTSAKIDQGFDVDSAKRQTPYGVSMSCSDKILKWNTVGLQGALFSHYLAPIYLTSISVGSLFDQGHVSRAICCRLSGDIAQYLPAGYNVLHPYIGRVSEPDPRHAAIVPDPDSINWTFGDEKIEILTSLTGKCSERSPFRTGASGASRLAKAGLLFRFRELATLADQKFLLNHSSYSDAKSSCHIYQTATRTLKEHLELTGFGLWAQKSPNLELFTK